MNCINPAQLLALARNRLPAGQAELIHAHLDAGCTYCRNQLGELQKLLVSTEKRRLLNPPEWLTHQARSLFAWHKIKAGEKTVGRIPAMLLFDSFATGLLPGFRTSGPMSRQMLYRAGEYDIDVSIDYVESRRAIDVMGQTMPLSADLCAVAGAEVKLLKQSEVAFDTQANEFGEFILDGIPEGIYDLQIKLRDEELDLVGVQALSYPD